jgi:hypothetical protein
LPAFLVTFFLAVIFFFDTVLRDVVFRFLLTAFFAAIISLLSGKEKAAIIHCLWLMGSPIF